MLTGNIQQGQFRVDLTDRKLVPVLESLSSPEAGAGEAARSEVERAIFSSQARRVLSDCLGELAGDVSLKLPGLADTLAHWVSTPIEHGIRPIGLAWLASALGERCRIAQCLVEVGFFASSTGIRREWSFELDAPAAMRLGQFLLRDVVAGQVRMARHCAVAHVTTASGLSTELEMDFESMGEAAFKTGEVSATLPSPIRIDQYSIQIVSADLVTADLLPDYAKSVYVGIDELDGCGEALSKALNYLAESSPAFFRWVTSVIREVVPIWSQDGALASSSSPWDRGTVAITADPRPAAIAEMLVHEASHQHFFAAKHLGKIEDGSDTNQYFSPMAHQNRSLERILLAYHALGNMILLHISLIENENANAEFSGERLTLLTAKLRQVEAILANSKALTTLGRAIFEPLEIQLCSMRESGLLRA